MDKNNGNNGNVHLWAFNQSNRNQQFKIKSVNGSSNPPSGGSPPITNNTKGKWSPVYKSSVIPVAATNLPDGKILAWSSNTRNFFGSRLPDGVTYTTTFNPSNNSFSEKFVETTNHDMFCPGIANTATGEIVVTGGNSSSRTSIYNPNTKTWKPGPMMNAPRGYHSMATLSNGQVFTVGGSWSGGFSNRKGEVYTAQGGWRSLSNVESNNTVRQGAPDPDGIYRDDNHAWLWAAPDGWVFQAGPGNEMHWINPTGQGQVINAGKRGDDKYSMNGSTVMYDKGKVLTFGGAEAYEGGKPASNRSYVIDINNRNNVKVNRSGNLNQARTLGNSVVLPNGQVVAIGGISKAALFSDSGARLAPEIWNPQTGKWSALASMKVPRTYHSVALLMQDGRIWAAGGGLCNNCAVNHSDAEIFTPPYLLNSNGSLATRPTITSAPNKANYNSSITVNTNSAINNFSLVRLSSVTHSSNNEQRRIPLSSSKTGNNKYRVQIPGNGWLPPGYYFLFAMNNKGVPSVAKTIKIGGAGNALQLILDGDYNIQSVANQQQLFNENNNNVRMGNKNVAQDNQVWRFKHVGGNVFTIQNKKTGRFLEVPFEKCGNASNVATINNGSGNHKRWRVVPVGTSYSLQPVHCSNMALDKNVGNNGNVHIFSFSAGNNNQRFKIIRVHGQGNENLIVNGTFYIRSKVNGQGKADIKPKGGNTGQVVMQNASSANTHRWKFTHLKQGIHSIQNLSSGRFLEVPFGKCQNGVKLNTWADSSSPQHTWLVKLIGSNYYLMPGHCYTQAADKNRGNNNTPHTFSYNQNNPNQQWDLVPVNGGARPRSAFVSELQATPMLGQKTALKWFVMQEQDKVVKQYVLQHLVGESNDFEDLEVISANEEEGLADYDFIHTTPVNGDNYYQVKIEYADGSSAYTPYRLVTFAPKPAAIQIAPNPAQEALNIDLSNYMDETVYYFISSISGKILKSGQFDQGHMSTTRLDLAEFQNGNYFIHLRPVKHREIVQQFIIMKDY